MESITVTFPIKILPEKVKFIMEENLKRNSKYFCLVSFEGVEDGENVYIITSDSAEAFYLIRVQACAMIQRLK